MSIVTKKGDHGTTRLLYGQEVSKADTRMEASGAIDELNAFLGQARALCDDDKTSAIIEHIQRDCFVLGAELATPKEHLHQLKQPVDATFTGQLESHIEQIEQMPGLLDDWSLPGATVAGAGLDVARVMARRAERAVVRWAQIESSLNPEIGRYLNRLSDLLWLLGRRYEILHDQDSALRQSKRDPLR